MLFLWLSLLLLYNTCQWSLANLYETALNQTGKSIKDRDREQKVGFQWCNTAITSACHNLQIYYSGTCQWMLKRIENMSKKEHGAARTETWVTFKKTKTCDSNPYAWQKEQKWAKPKLENDMTKNDSPTTSITIRIPDLDFTVLKICFVSEKPNVSKNGL